MLDDVYFHPFDYRNWDLAGVRFTDPQLRDLPVQPLQRLYLAVTQGQLRNPDLQSLLTELDEGWLDVDGPIVERAIAGIGVCAAMHHGLMTGGVNQVVSVHRAIIDMVANLAGATKTLPASHPHEVLWRAVFVSYVGILHEIRAASKIGVVQRYMILRQSLQDRDRRQSLVDTDGHRQELQALGLMLLGLLSAMRWEHSMKSFSLARSALGLFFDLAMIGEPNHLATAKLLAFLSRHGDIRPEERHLANRLAAVFGGLGRGGSAQDVDGFVADQIELARRNPSPSWLSPPNRATRLRKTDRILN